MSCKTPLTKRDKLTKKLILVPCNKCANCRARKVSEWSFRLMQEEKHAKWAYFITLTYNDKVLPYTRNGFRTVHKRDLQLFFKRLRKFQSSKRYCKKAGVPYIEQPIKYYGVGEYGGRFKRPHYHVILFNASPELVERAWTAGHVHYGFVSGASVGYTMKYIGKPSSVPIHRNDDRTPEFSLMSKGLGECYLTKNMIQWHNHSTSVVESRYHVMCNGVKIAMPRYYRERLYTKDDKNAIAFKIRQENNAFDWNELQSDIYNYKKLGLYGYKNQNLEQTECSRSSEAIRKKSISIINDSRSKHVVANIASKVRPRSSASVNNRLRSGILF